MTTYVGVRHIGQKHTAVVRTEESLQRASRRAVLRTPSFNPMKGPPRSAQEVADEKNLSRSKEYPNKGRREQDRNLTRMQREDQKFDARLEREEIEVTSRFPAADAA